MLMRSRVGRNVVAMLLCACVVTLSANSPALAQARGNSGLPAASGNPLGDLQAQITKLQQQISALSALGTDVSMLKQQLSTLQGQLGTLQGQLGTLNTQNTALTKEQAELRSMLESQLKTLSTQTTAMIKMQSQLNTLTSQMETLAAEASAYGGSAGLTVYDSKGQKVGDVIGVQDSIPWVSLSIEDQTVVLQMFPLALVGGNLYYDGPNCTGNVYINNNPAFTKGVSAFSLGAVAEPGGVIYASDPAASPAMLLATQLPSWRDMTKGAFCATNSFKANVVPAKPVFMLDTMFQRPFHVR
jgi:regulator of replication initiation timing